MGERKENYIQEQMSALHFDCFEGMRVLGNACVLLCYAQELKIFATKIARFSELLSTV